MTDLNMILAYILGFGPVVLIMLSLPIVAIGGVALGMTRPVWLLFAFVTLLLSFGQSTYGQLQASNVVYSRGTGLLFFSVVVWALWGMALISLIWGGVAKRAAHPTNLSAPAYALFTLFLGHLAVGLLLEQPLREVLGAAGLVNFMHLAVFIFVLTKLLQNPEDLTWLTRLLLIVGGLRGLFGLIRWAAFGGDPANVYENVERLGVHLTFFDICDSMVAAVVLSYCMRKLTSAWNTLSTAQRLGLALLALLECAVILLSYRRTAWGGLLLVMIWLFICFPPRVRTFGWLIFPALLLIVGSVGAARLSKITAGRGVFESFFYDLMPKTAFGAQSSRLLELKLALETFYDNPIFGVGAWGRFNGSHLIGWHTGEAAYNLVHSSVVHIMFKTGLVGLTLVAVTLGLVVRFLVRSRGMLAERERWLFDSCIAGLLFFIPDFLLGTPIPQFRTMMFYGLLIGLPYVIVGISVRAPSVPAR
jgi:hypothetical protein